MCFSASASFTAAAVLVPIGIYGTHIARTTDQKAYAPLAMTPAFFGTQQFVEGLQWISLDNGGLEPLGTITARGFLFFAYCDSSRLSIAPLRLISSLITESFGSSFSKLMKFFS